MDGRASHTAQRSPAMLRLDAIERLPRVESERLALALAVDVHRALAVRPVALEGLEFCPTPLFGNPWFPDTPKQWKN